MTDWHDYRLSWQPRGCFFQVDDIPLLQTPFRPGGPLGLVCWVDNQYMVATATGRLGWGTVATEEAQWLEVAELTISSEH